MNRKAGHDDRRVLSSEDVRDLLDIQRPPKDLSEVYDPKFWAELDHEVKRAARQSRQFIAGWRLRKDLAVLRRHGWFPSGEGPLATQLLEDVQDGRLPWADSRAWTKRLTQTVHLLNYFAAHNTFIAKVAN